MFIDEYLSEYGPKSSTCEYGWRLLILKILFENLGFLS